MFRAFYGLGEYDLAIEEANLNKQLFGELDSKTLTTMNNLATVYSNAGQDEDAIDIHIKTLETRIQVSGELHEDTTTSQNSLATAYYSAGYISQAADLFEVNYRAIADIFGETHVNTLATASNLAATFEALGRIDDTLKIHQESAKASEKRGLIFWKRRALRWLNIWKPITRLLKVVSMAGQNC